MKIIFCCLFAMTLIACTQEPVYRGVPEKAWSQLSSEQKQLIVDQSFQTEIHQTV